nr:MAG TPA: hypothetical protein [Caudoviricetes sp.]
MNEPSASDFLAKNNLFFIKKNLTYCKSKKILFFIAH